VFTFNEAMSLQINCSSHHPAGAVERSRIANGAARYGSDASDEED
jgi:hypothetical protein